MNEESIDKIYLVLCFVAFDPLPFLALMELIIVGVENVGVMLCLVQPQIKKC